MTIENTSLGRSKIEREKAQESLRMAKEYEYTHKMYSQRLKNGTIISAKSPEKLAEIINELKKNGSIRCKNVALCFADAGYGSTHICE